MQRRNNFNEEPFFPTRQPLNNLADYCIVDCKSPGFCRLNRPKLLTKNYFKPGGCLLNLTTHEAISSFILTTAARYYFPCRFLRGLVDTKQSLSTMKQLLQLYIWGQIIFIYLNNAGEDPMNHEIVNATPVFCHHFHLCKECSQLKSL